MKYELPPAIAEKFNRFGGATDNSLNNEVTLIRAMLETAVEKNQSALAVQLLNTLQKAINTQDMVARRNEEYLHKSEITSIAMQLVGLVAEHFQDVPGWQDRVDIIVTKFMGVLEPKETT